ncbi:MAG TPA: 2-amino-4-hydroxy-6-hydroxymethyldihydropteridine diphosphokinase [Gammaproteobacteria bacterium]|nr:2-amino-4-hydroxy-6-hydroxymethyldihydropteridine diphosphokinase [Gammaproteobacteria bacterium]
MTVVKAYIAIGSNLQDPILQAKQAQTALAMLSITGWYQHSPLYCSAPMGPQDQPDYINGVTMIDTCLTPLSLLSKLQAIEKAQGRIRKRHWGERTLDLDLLLYGDMIYNSTTLTVPHPGITERDFVLYPLADIAPDITIPGHGPIASCLLSCRKSPSLQRINT